MKLCKLCGSTYDDRVDFCFRDGTPLSKAATDAPEAAPVVSDAGVENPTETEEMDAPMPVAMLRGAEPEEVRVPTLPLERDPVPSAPPGRVSLDDAGPSDLPAPLNAPLLLPRAEHADEEGTLAGLGVLPLLDQAALASGSPFEEEDLAPPEEIQPIQAPPEEAVPARTEAPKAPMAARVTPVNIVAPPPVPEVVPEPVSEPMFGSEAPAPPPRVPPPPARGFPLLPVLGVVGLLVVGGGGVLLGLRPGLLQRPVEVAATPAPVVPPAPAPLPEPTPVPEPAPEVVATAPVPEPVAPAAPVAHVAAHPAAPAAPVVAAAAAPEVKPSTLNVISTPAGARVVVDDKAVGQTPLDTPIKGGLHVVRLEMAGYQSTSQTVKAEGAPLAISAALDPLPMTGQVNIFGPTGATVWLDGKKVGPLPVTAQILEGKHVFKVETAEGTTFSQSQDVKFSAPGQPMIVSLSAP